MEYKSKWSSISIENIEDRKNNRKNWVKNQANQILNGSFG